MAPRIKPPFRADHVGSLLRPQKLLQTRSDQKAGKISAADLRHIEDESIREVVKMQEDIGLQGITDGEFRRASWHMDFLYQIGGMSKVQDDLKVKFHNEKGDVVFAPAAIRVSGKLTLDKTIFGDDFSFLKSATTRMAKLTIPSPNMAHYRSGRAAIDETVYPDLDKFWTDLQQVYADEIERLGKLGCTYLQLDDTSLAYLNDPEQRKHVSEIGGDAEHQHLTYIRNLNAALAKKPSGMSVCTHMCRGNFRSSWVASGGYDFVAEALFTQLNVDGFFLEYDDARSGTFAPLRFVPKNKMVVLGLVTTKKAALEKKDDLKRRIDEASKYVPLEQICLSPQCGFSSTVEGNLLTVNDEIAKLKLIVETAREVWG
ncbi:MAG TPA: 5-methyltetrahydropteroyltriglutamate--homocysteine S-methyltransferase [Candidatus Acidoferrales bacterium]|jgi:5-methyltetrahydropteroyltriglutamate--homocysteine methyltransferase|nr:5-methyltetrahydropteroyltriglutamate--homocysteine S-methyltransferase [Candidatus Acidoferrales bacterium]